MSKEIRSLMQETPGSFWQKITLNTRFEAISWALFMIMLGTLWLMPDGIVPRGTWLIGTGLILLGLNLVRYLNEIWTDIITLVLGVTMLASGIGEVFFGVQLFFPILLFTIGTSVVIKQFVVKEDDSTEVLSEVMKLCFEAQGERI